MNFLFLFIAILISIIPAGYLYDRGADSWQWDNGNVRMQKIEEQQLGGGSASGVISKVGSFAQPSSTGNQAITDVGFQPKVIMFWMSHATSEGVWDDAAFSFGAATTTSATGEQVNARFACDDAAATSACANFHGKTSVIGITDPAASILAEADFVTMDANGFTINWTNVDATARIVNYLALGGTGLTNATVGSATQKTGTTGSLAVTGLGFQPEAVILFNTKGSTTFPESSAASIYARFGFATGNANEGMVAWTIGNGQTTMDSARYQQTDDTTGIILTSGVNSLADFVTMDADGFTLNWSTVSSAYYYLYIALAGGEYTLGSLNQNVMPNTGNQMVTGLNQEPAALIAFSFNAAASASIATGASVTWGISDGANSFTHWIGDADNVADALSNTNMDRTKFLTIMTEGTTPATTTVATASFDTDGFTLNNTTVDATSREIIYLSIGNMYVAPTTDERQLHGPIWFE